MLHTEELETCPTRDRMSYGWVDYHFAGLCEDCDVRVHATGSLEKIEEMYRTGRLNQDVYEAYVYVWSTATMRYSTLGDATIPTNPTVRRIARKMYRRIGKPVPSSLT